MARHLVVTLDQCIDLIARQGATVEVCLALYPQEAQELEPYLRIVARCASAFALSPSPATKEAGRQRLQAELAAILALGPQGFSFDEVLDRCVTRILGGETVGACLASYPQLAQALEPSLRTVARATGSFALPGDSAAKDRGRLRLRSELSTLEGARRRGRQRPPWLVLSFALQQRWAVVVISASLALFLGGVGLVSASGDSLPGQPLYSVKRAAEEVRLALEFSPQGKAERYMAYAERRGEEMGALIQQGNPSQIAPAQQNLERNLASAASIATGLQDLRSVSDLQSKLEQNASNVLARLQTSLESSPKGARQAAGESFIAVGAVYGERLQTVSALAPKEVVSAGVLQLRATDPPPPGVQSILVEVGQIEVHRADWAQDRWLFITIHPQQFDLLDLGDVQRFLGELEIPTGVYTKLRLSIQEANVVVEGVSHPVKVPSKTLHLTRPFRVEEGKTTVVVLDFDGASSLRTTGKDTYVLTPQVQVLAREPEQRERVQKRQEEPAPAASRTQGPAALTGAPGLQGKGERLEIEGEVRQLTSDSLQVGNKVIAIPPSSGIKELLSEGQRQKLEVQVQADGTFLAREVKGDGDGLMAAESSAIGLGKREVQSVRPALESFKGVVQALSPGLWNISGRNVYIGSETVVTGTPAVGAGVEIRGMAQGDGSLLAVMVAIHNAPPQPADGGSGPDKSTGEQGQSTPDRGQTGSSQGQEQNGGQLQRAVHLKGTLKVQGPGRWALDGRTVVMDYRTEVKDSLRRGDLVEVDGVELPDGTVLATRIVALPPPGTPQEAPSAAPTPTPGIRPAFPIATIPGINREPQATPTPTPVRQELNQKPTPTPETRLPVLASPTPVTNRLPEAILTPTPVRQESNRRAPSTPTPTPTPPSLTAISSPREVRLEGIIRGISSATIVVDNRRVLVTPSTKVEGNLALGARVKVEGTVDQNQSLVAKRIVVES
ncbi:MAG: DUF4382 domain-containing protein [Chloroflexi bacterium]|nr:DUF4382 domain-containing protein [Chloroflexota bacterium]